MPNRRQFRFVRIRIRKSNRRDAEGRVALPSRNGAPCRPAALTEARAPPGPGRAGCGRSSRPPSAAHPGRPCNRSGPPSPASAARPARASGRRTPCARWRGPVSGTGQLAVPEHGGSAFYGQAVDGSLVQLDGAHERQSFPRRRTGAKQPWTRFVPVPRRPEGRPEFPQAGELSFRKSVFKSQPTDVVWMAPQATTRPFPRPMSDLRRKNNNNEYNRLASILARITPNAPACPSGRKQLHCFVMYLTEINAGGRAGAAMISSSSPTRMTTLQ